MIKKLLTIKTELKVKGFHCSSCEMLIKDVAESNPEIISCDVNIKTGKIILEYKEGFDITKFKKEIESLGDYKFI